MAGLLLPPHQGGSSKSEVSKLFWVVVQARSLAPDFVTFAVFAILSWDLGHLIKPQQSLIYANLCAFFLFEGP